MELLFDLGWKALATALAILLVAKLGERGGALMASVAMTFPMNAGPGFFFMALEQGAGFVSESALIAFAATGGVLAFVALFVRLAGAHRFGPAVAVALLAWLAAALVTMALPRSLISAGGVIALGGVLVVLLRTTSAAALSTTAIRAGWHLLLARGLIAGLVVASVAQAAGILGPAIAGLAYAFPTTMLASLWVLQRHYGQAFTLATMARVPAGIATYAGFCLALHLAAGPVAPLTAWAIALLVALAIALGRALTGRPSRPRPGPPAPAPRRPGGPPWSRAEIAERPRSR